MTSQAMILTKRLGILATDRQQTMADGKTYGGVEKIFEISQIHSSAIMINGSADFVNIPIETLIREFRFNTDFRQINTIEEIKTKFIGYLSKNTDSLTTDEFLEKSLKIFKQELIVDIDEKGFENVINERRKRKIFPFIKKYSNYLDEFLELFPENFDKKNHNELLWEIFSFELQYEATGIVIAGFDLKSHYPSFFEIDLYYNDNGKIMFEVVDSTTNSKEPIIKVFAINEEAYTFITGVNDEFIEFIVNYIIDSNNSILENLKFFIDTNNFEYEIYEFMKNQLENEYGDINHDITNFRFNAVDYTANSIENLPDWLLCIFAELLIRLTAVKQKTSSEIESVSIETDILIISKIKSFKHLKNYEEIF